MTIPLVPEWRPELDEPSGNWTIQVTTRLELAEGELLDLCANLHGPVVTYAQIELQAAPPDADIDTWLEGVLGRTD